MACDACNAKFKLFTRKKQCMDCKRYFCSKCVIKRSGKILSCDSCSMLSQRPLILSIIVQMRSKDLRQYLLAKKVPIIGCIEKEDLIKRLISFANGTNDNYNAGHVENIFPCSSVTTQLTAETCERNADALNQVYETNTTRMGENDIISGTISAINICPDGRTTSTTVENGKESKISNLQYSKVFEEGHVSPLKLSTINALSDLECLSVKQLKKLLTANRVDYKGCVEKRELLNRAILLWKEYKQSRTGIDIPDENLCKICKDEPIECVILECGHIACCLNCGKQMAECPICKQYVVRVVRFFKA